MISPSLRITLNLKVSGCPFFVILTFWEGLAVEQHQVRGCPNLSSISLCKCDLVTDRALQRLIACDALRQLDIAECRKITDSSIMALVKARALSCLILRGCHGLTDASLQMLARNCCSLKILGESPADDCLKLDCLSLTILGERALSTYSRQSRLLPSLCLCVLSFLCVCEREREREIARVFGF
jgi:hypothetical protein